MANQMQQETMDVAVQQARTL